LNFEFASYEIHGFPGTAVVLPSSVQLLLLLVFGFVFSFLFSNK